VTFGGFTFASDVLLGQVAAFYGLSIPAAEHGTSLAEFVRTRLPRNPAVGDRIKLKDVELVVRGRRVERITRIGLELEPGEPAPSFIGGSSPASAQSI
jgi:cell volume regulation protein A